MRLSFRVTPTMRIRPWLIAAPVLVAAAACNSVLDVSPSSTIPTATAITDAAGARAALVGAYAGLQATGLYYGGIITFPEDVSDNGRFSGTLTSYADGDQNAIRADNSMVADIWESSYADIDRVNEIIAQVPNATGLSSSDRDEIMGEAYFLRALDYHNLVKLYGGVPLVLQPTTSIADAASVTRATSAQVYAQILSDLAKAEQLISNTDQTTQASLGAAYAIEARVRLYMSDWAGAEAAASKVESMGYSLAPNFADLFDPNGNATPEDIFRVVFTPAQYNEVGYYYLTRSLGGRYEVAPTSSIITAFDSASGGSIKTYNPPNPRAAASVARDGSRAYAARYSTSIGAEHVHVIRFAEVILIRAEALAHLGRLTEAVDELNRIRVRAGEAPQPDTGRTQADVLASIAAERRLELAFEGDRWPDLVRTGMATTVLGINASQTLFPIPQREIDTTPGLTQNPGY
jgi:hypothetical protein